MKQNKECYSIVYNDMVYQNYFFFKHQFSILIFFFIFLKKWR